MSQKNSKDKDGHTISHLGNRLGRKVSLMEPTKNLTVRITGKEFDDFLDKATHEGKGRNQLVQQWIREYLA